MIEYIAFLCMGISREVIIQCFVYTLLDFSFYQQLDSGLELTFTQRKAFFFSFKAFISMQIATMPFHGVIVIIHKCLSQHFIRLRNVEVSVRLSFELLLGAHVCVRICRLFFIWIYFFNQANILCSLAFSMFQHDLHS